VNLRPDTLGPNGRIGVLPPRRRTPPEAIEKIHPLLS